MISWWNPTVHYQEEKTFQRIIVNNFCQNKEILYQSDEKSFFRTLGELYSDKFGERLDCTIFNRLTDFLTLTNKCF